MASGELLSFTPTAGTKSPMDIVMPLELPPCRCVGLSARRWAGTVGALARAGGGAGGEGLLAATVVCQTGKTTVMCQTLSFLF